MQYHIDFLLGGGIFLWHFLAVSQHPFNVRIIRTRFRAHVYVLPEVYFQSVSKQSMGIHMPALHVYVRTYVCTYIYTCIKQSPMFVASAAVRKINLRIIPAIKASGLCENLVL